MTTLTPRAGSLTMSFDLSYFAMGRVVEATAESYVVEVNAATDRFFGSGLSYEPNGPFAGGGPKLAGGVLEGWRHTDTSMDFEASGFSIPATTLFSWLATYPKTQFNRLVFDGNDSIMGGAQADQLVGEAGSDTIVGGAGDDLLTGGFFDEPDEPSSRDGDDWLMGGEGDDLFLGSAGDDKVDGGPGVDWLSFGGLQVRSRGVWNSAEDSGGAYDVIDRVSGRTFTTTFQGVENFGGSVFDDYLAGNGRDNTVFGGGGDDTIVDSMDGGGRNYLRGGDGNDSVWGGEGFDDINGNAGNDTIHGGDFGGDWVVGGQDHDLLFGDGGDDIVLGNLGADTLDGGHGADVVRGGQQDDSLRGGAGDDWLAGDRGNDTISGGAGADIFHLHAESGLDRVTDFSPLEGDRVHLLDGPYNYSVRQIGSDAVINWGDASMVLVGVQLSTVSIVGLSIFD